MSTEVEIKIKVKGYEGLADYLGGHDEDICLDINDFGRLSELFVAVFDREPSVAKKEENEHKPRAKTSQHSCRHQYHGDIDGRLACTVYRALYCGGYI